MAAEQANSDSSHHSDRGNSLGSIGRSSLPPPPI